MASIVETPPLPVTDTAGGGARQKGKNLIRSYEDNRLVSQVFGEHDSHLDVIEEMLDVELTPRGNKVAIAGDVAARKTAAIVLDGLYERARKGHEINRGDVEGSIRMATAHDIPGEKSSHAVIQTRRKTIVPRSPGQTHYIHAIKSHELTFGLGPAGTGKSYLAVACAAEALVNGSVSRIIFSRPAVEAGERLGFLPGDMKEKVDPYLRPLYDALYDVMPANMVNRGLSDGTIEIAPLAFMRGRTLQSAFIILDEAQNTTCQQMKMFLTRLGEGSRMVVNGDPSQVDLPPDTVSGLADATSLLEGVRGIATIRLTSGDIVRHPLVARIVGAYESKSDDGS